MTLGPDQNGKTVALYSRCSKSDGTAATPTSYDLAKKKESKLDFSRSDRDEAWPSQWEGRYAWVEQRGKGDDPNDFKDGNCDAPMTRGTSSSSAVKTLSTGTCGTVTGQALRKSTIVQTVMWADDVARNFSELRQLSSKGGSAKRLARLHGDRRAATSTPLRCSTTSSSMPSGPARARPRGSCASSAAPARCSWSRR